MPKPNTTAIRVAQYTPAGDLVKVHASQTAAAISIGQGCAAQINAAMDAKKLAHGFVWKTAGSRVYKKIKIDFAPATRAKKSRGRPGTPIASYDLSGNLVKAYASVAAAAVNHGCVASSIYRFINEPGYALDGLYWRLIEDVANPPKTTRVVPTTAAKRRNRRRAVKARAKQKLANLHKIVIFTKKGKPGKTHYKTLQAVADKLGCTRENVRQALMRPSRKCKGYRIEYLVKVEEDC